MNPSAYNTLTRKKEVLQPKEPNQPFGMYCCGPTVYGPAHIGNFRTFAAQDVLRRTLEVAGVKVKHVRNITDVDDKTIRESRRLSMSLKDFTKKWEDKFHADCRKLNLLVPSVEPRATEHIKEQLEMVETLVKKGFAYAAKDGSVYFRISSFADYGRLSGLDKENLATQSVNSAGDANNADEYERDNVSDFALWKGRKEEDGENFWKSPWGEGRPGWHIECSAMSQKYLGKSFNLHGGGIDLMFPHHENEIAQSECASGVSPCVRHWFHSAHLMVEGEKMSKSLGNLFTLDDLVKRGYTPMQIRLALISGHYRQPLNFTFKGLDDAKSAILKIEKLLKSALENLKISVEDYKKLVRPNSKFENTAFEKAWETLCDDINVPRALGEIFTALARAKENPLNPSDIEAFASLMYALGLSLFEEDSSAAKEADIPAEIKQIADDRWHAKLEKNYKLADELRAKALSQGWIILDKKDGYDLKKA